MHPLGHKIVERIIHKAVLGDPAKAQKPACRDANAKMRAKTSAIGPGMATVLVTFIQDFKAARLQAFAQARFKLMRRGCSVHGANRYSVCSVLRIYGVMYKPCPMMNTRGKA